MKKLGWLLSAFIVIGVSASSAYAGCKVDPLPEKYVCNMTVETALQDGNLKDLSFWQEPACMEKIIQNFDKYKGYKDKILTGLSNADNAWTEAVKKGTISGTTDKYDLWADRKGHIRYLFDDINDMSQSRNIDGSTQASCQMYAGLWSNPKIGNFVMTTGDEIVKAYVCLDNHETCTGKFSVLKGLEKKDKETFVQMVTIYTGCIARLVAGEKKAYETNNGQMMQGYIALIDEMKKVDVGKAQCTMHRKCFQGNSYARCHIDIWLGKLFGTSQPGTGGGNGGSGGGKPKPAPSSYKISNFKVKDQRYGN